MDPVESQTPTGRRQNLRRLRLCMLYIRSNRHPRTTNLLRHGSKGGGFIDGMYTSQASLTSNLGIAIIQDAGILSDHDLIISSIDLGIEQYHPSKEKQNGLILEAL